MLRLWQYLAGTSLWIDEAALARNILERHGRALAAPLDYAQVAPVGFLFVEKAIAAVAGSGEYALRAFPIACGLASLVLFARLAARVLPGWAAVYAVALFSFGIPFIYFSSQLKQYSSDIAATLCIVLAALVVRERGLTPRRAFWLGAAGVAAAAISQTALVVMAGVAAGQALLAWTERDRAAARGLAVTWALWGPAAVLVALHSLGSVSATDREYFRWFWSDGFMPVPPATLPEALWLPRKLIWVFGAFAPGLGHTHGGMNYRWSAVFAAVMLYGCWALWRDRRDAALFLLLPVAGVLVLSAASLYPFTARLVSFVVPSLLLATAAGAARLLSRLPRQLQFLAPVVLAVMGGAPLYAIATAMPPSRVQEMRPVVSHVSSRHERGDRIYVYSGAGLAFSYYAPRARLSQDGVVRGRCSLDDPRRYLRELDGLRGHPRVWLVFTHEQRDGELTLILGYLDRIGRRLDSIVVDASNGRTIEQASAYLFDLSDPRRLASADATSYPLPATLTQIGDSLKQWGCYGITGGDS